MKTKIISAVTAITCILALLAGCGKPVVDKNNNTVNGTFSDYLIAEKIGYLKTTDFLESSGGIIYKNNGKYGIVSLNGLYDTGAVYEEASTSGSYFQVWSKAPSSLDDINGLNSSKLIDGKGNTIVPEGYAAFYTGSERYIKVFTVAEKTDDEEKCLISISENYYCVTGVSISEGWQGYTGTWHVYDTVNKRTVPNLSGTNDTLLIIHGDYISYKNSDGEYVTVDENGNTVVTGKTVFDDGSYATESDVGKVYSADGKLLFEYDLEGFVPMDFKNGYYSARKYTDDGTKYAVMDNTGKLISAEFDEFIQLYGDIFESDDKIYNLNGESIIDGTYTSVYLDKVFGRYYMLHNEGYYTIIDKNGAVYFNGPYDDEHTVDSSTFLASAKIDGEEYFYSYKDKDYTIKGYYFAPWIVKSENGSLYDLIDTMTGKKLIEGYKSYTSVSKNDGAYYVYAISDTTTDVYLIESSALLADVTSKKEDLFDELTKAFEKEGITATVNRETGEIALDSSVLFGGDSAELTSDGKAFLNKFINAYSTVIGMDKFAAFISQTLIEGHTAPVDGDSYENDLQLSKDRAENVKNYCLSSETGVNVSSLNNKLESVGYSNSKPVYNSDGSVNMEASRRVSFRFIVNIV